MDGDALHQPPGIAPRIDLDHGRAKNRAAKFARHVMQSPQQVMPAHRMGHCDQGKVCVLGQRQDNLPQYRIQILVIVGEIRDMRLAGIGQKPLRSALSAPVEGDDRKPAVAQLVDHLEIFLDIFALAVQQQTEPPRTCGIEPARSDSDGAGIEKNGLKAVGGGNHAGWSLLGRPLGFKLGSWRKNPIATDWLGPVF